MAPGGSLGFEQPPSANAQTSQNGASSRLSARLARSRSARATLTGSGSAGDAADTGTALRPTCANNRSARGMCQSQVTKPTRCGD